MIKSIADKETEKILRAEFSEKLPSGIQKTARRKLIYLDETDTWQDLIAAPGGNRLEATKGSERTRQYSIRINTQWHIRFEWKSPHDAYGVMITDYQ